MHNLILTHGFLSQKFLRQAFFFSFIVFVFFQSHELHVQLPYTAVCMCVVVVALWSYQDSQIT